MVFPGERREGRGTTAVVAGTIDGKSNKLKVMFMNVDGIISNMIEIKDYLNFQKNRCILHGRDKTKGRNPNKFTARGIQNLEER